MILYLSIGNVLQYITLNFCNLYKQSNIGMYMYQDFNLLDFRLVIIDKWLKDFYRINCKWKSECLLQIY